MRRHHKKDRLEVIQDQLDVLMDEVTRLRNSIDVESRRRTYPFPFERAAADDFQPPATTKSDANNN